MSIKTYRTKREGVVRMSLKESREGNSVNHSFVIDGVRYKFLGFEQPDGKITKKRGDGIPVFQVRVKQKVEFT